MEPARAASRTPPPHPSRSSMRRTCREEAELPERRRGSWMCCVGVAPRLAPTEYVAVKAEALAAPKPAASGKGPSKVSRQAGRQAQVQSSTASTRA